MCYYILRVWGRWWVGGEAAYSYLAAMLIHYYSCSLVAAADATIFSTRSQGMYASTAACSRTEHTSNISAGSQVTQHTVLT